MNFFNVLLLFHLLRYLEGMRVSLHGTPHDGKDTRSVMLTLVPCICIVKKEGVWIRDFLFMGAECQMQTGVGANQKADKITLVTLTEPVQWIECAFAPCWRYEATILYLK